MHHRQTWLNASPGIEAAVGPDLTEAPFNIRIKNILLRKLLPAAVAIINPPQVRPPVMLVPRPMMISSLCFTLVRSTIVLG
jgi:hypothetical protein